MKSKRDQKRSHADQMRPSASSRITKLSKEESKALKSSAAAKRQQKKLAIATKRAVVQDEAASEAAVRAMRAVELERRMRRVDVEKAAQARAAADQAAAERI